MKKRVRKHNFSLFVLLFAGASLHAQQQTLLLSDAIHNGVNNYQTIQAKKNYYKASKELVANTKNEYLPNIIAGFQDAYGTVNGQYGPLSAGSIAGVSSSGPVYSEQVWHAGFASQYVVNTNWEVFSFGRLKSRIEAFKASASKDSADIAQEEFIQSVKVADTYLNLLIAQKLISNAQSNLDRATYVQQVVLAKAKTGLIAGVDSSISNAQVSSARIALIDAQTTEQEQRSLLAQLMNAPPVEYDLDTGFFFKQIPSVFDDDFDVAQNPQVQFYKSRVTASDEYADYLKKSILPGVNLFGIFQSKGSGFGYDYSPANSGSYSKSFTDGLNPTRSNYVTGVSIAWNIMSLSKIKHQVSAQRFLSLGYANEADLISTQLKDQLVLADQRIANVMQRFKETPVQYKAALDAYLQKTVLYKNGLTDIVDVQQALFALNKAETDAGISYIAVWRALLLKCAASGDFNLFISQAR
ncbi:TolC family protein [Parafilimonas sp.]|uniref:TolC family protein n=1 Tax=Parafilimonas sp. TaxID=1969739 RepID=UPI0039E52837